MKRDKMISENNMIYCPYCGSKITQKGNFCINCGSKLSYDNQTYINPSPENFTYHKQDKNKTLKSKEVAILLHLILPGLGYAYLENIPKFIIVLVPITICGIILYYLLPYYLGYAYSVIQFGLPVELCTIVGAIIWIRSLIDTFQEVDNTITVKKIK